MYAISVKKLSFFLALALLIASLSSCTKNKPNVLHSGPYILAVYPFTYSSLLESMHGLTASKCHVLDCSREAIILNADGHISNVNVKGMIDSRLAFSPDNNAVAMTDVDKTHVLKNGVVTELDIANPSIVANYIEIDNSGNILIAYQQPITEDNDSFGISIATGNINDRKLLEKNTPSNGDFIKCGNNLFMFSTGEPDEQQKELIYIEYVYDYSSKELVERRRQKEMDFDTLAVACDKNDNINYLVSKDQKIIRGTYSENTGLQDEQVSYPLNDFNPRATDEYAYFDGDSVWALNNAGEMHVFDRKTATDHIAWDMSAYFIRQENHYIEAISIFKEDSVFFFGKPKQRPENWVMIEVERESGKTIRSIFLPFLDNRSELENYDYIYIGDVEKFRTWADTQPKFDLSTIGE